MIGSHSFGCWYSNNAFCLLFVQSTIYIPNAEISKMNKQFRKSVVSATKQYYTLIRILRTANNNSSNFWNENWFKMKFILQIDNKRKTQFTNKLQYFRVTCVAALILMNSEHLAKIFKNWLPFTFVSLIIFCLESILLKWLYWICWNSR